MTRISATVTRIVASTVLTGAAVLGGASVAHASPSGCVVSNLSNGVDVFCSKGYGKYRGVVHCDVNNWPDYTRNGPWVTAGNWSSAWCDSGDRAYNQSMQTG